MSWQFLLGVLLCIPFTFFVMKIIYILIIEEGPAVLKYFIMCICLFFGIALIGEYYEGDGSKGIKEICEKAQKRIQAIEKEVE